MGGGLRLNGLIGLVFSSEKGFSPRRRPPTLPKYLSVAVLRGDSRGQSRNSVPTMYPFSGPLKILIPTGPRQESIRVN